MSLDEIQQGIDAVRDGDIQRGEMLLRRGLQSPNIANDVRAIALMWLAETNPSIQFKIQCYQAALSADPSNADIRRRLGELVASQSPPPGAQPPAPPGTKGSTPSDPPPNLPGYKQPDNANVSRLWEFGVRGGPNGIGTGFMVVRNGLVATARFVVGSVTEVVLLTRDGREIDGKVVRSYPRYDLAFIRARLNVPYLRDMSLTNGVKPRTRLIVDDYTEQRARGKCNFVGTSTPEGWFHTTFPSDLPPSFTGAPIMDERNDLVGMLTRNTVRDGSPREGQLYGLHVSLIRRKIEAYHAEMDADPNRVYCGTCGCLSKAGTEGFFYCETCGAVLPFARRIRRTPHPEAYIYYEE